ncbi:MAG: hypothetical protein RSG55_06175, partial [Oscillospiraceae bacterium]
LKDLADNAESAGAIMSEDTVKALDKAGDAFDHVKQRAKAFVGEVLLDIIGDGKTAAETMRGLSEDIDKTNNIQNLIDNYKRLKTEVAASSNSSGELSEKTAELEKAKRALIEASNGVISSTAIESGVFDEQVGALEKATRAERDYLKSKMISQVLENSGEKEKRKIAVATDQQATAEKQLAYAMEERSRTQKKVREGLNGETALRTDDEAVEYWQEKIASATAAMTEIKKSSSEAETALRFLVDNGLMTAAEAADTFADSGIEVEAVLAATGDATEKAIPEINDMSTAIALLNEEYDTASKTALSSLQSQIGMWEMMDNSVKTSIADMQAALDSQMQWYTDYTANLETIMAVEIPGIDMQPILNSISDGTPQAAERAAALAEAITSGNTAAIEKLANDAAAVAAKQVELSEAMGAAAFDYNAKIKEIVETTAKAVKEMDKTNEAKTSGTNTIQGYINGVVSKGKTLNATMARVANNAMAAWKRAFEEKSPSKVMEKSGENAILGDIKGVENMQNKLKKTYAETASMAQRSYDNATPASISVISDSGSRQTVNHTGTIRVQGVSSTGETLAVADIVMEQLRREARM